MEFLFGLLALLCSPSVVKFAMGCILRYLSNFVPVCTAYWAVSIVRDLLNFMNPVPNIMSISGASWSREVANSS